MKDRRWIIWVQDIRGTNGLFLLVYRPKHSTFLRFFSRWARTRLVHQEGPIYYSSVNEKAEWTEELMDIGADYVPEGTPVDHALSLGEVQQIINLYWHP